MLNYRKYVGPVLRTLLVAVVLLAVGSLSGCNRDRESSVEWLQQQVWSQPDNGALYLRLGYALQRDGRQNDAAVAFAQAVKLDPKLDEAYHALATQAFHRKRYNDALRFFRQHLAAAPRDSSRLYNVGNAYMQLKQYDKAAAAYSEAIDNSRAFVEAHYNLAVCYSKLHRPAQAQPIYEWLLVKNNYLAHSLKKHLDSLQTR